MAVPEEAVLEIERAFGKFVSSDSLRNIEKSIAENSKELPPLQKEKICFVVLLVRDDAPEVVADHLSHAFQVLLDDGGTVEDMMSSIATVVFEPESVPREWSMDALLSRLGPNVRAVYGRGEYLRGAFGSQGRFNYGTVFPSFHGMLEILFQLEFGSSRKI